MHRFGTETVYVAAVPVSSSTGLRLWTDPGASPALPRMWSRSGKHATRISALEPVALGAGWALAAPQELACRKSCVPRRAKSSEVPRRKAKALGGTLF